MVKYEGGETISYNFTVTIRAAPTPLNVTVSDAADVAAGGSIGGPTTIAPGGVDTATFTVIRFRQI
jgi:hypothetical protein